MLEEKCGTRPSQSTHQAEISVACVGELSAIESGPSKSILGEGSKLGHLKRGYTIPLEAQLEKENENQQYQTDHGSQKEGDVDKEMLDGAHPLGEDKPTKAYLNEAKCSSLRAETQVLLQSEG